MAWSSPPSPSTGDEIVPTARRVRPDVVLLDIEMPGGDGLTAAGRLRHEVPDCRVLILTTFGRPGYLRRAMEAGASGFLVKDGPVDALAVAIRRVLAGEKTGTRNRIEAATHAISLGWL